VLKRYLQAKRRPGEECASKCASGAELFSRQPESDEKRAGAPYAWIVRTGFANPRD
jgi:hypothetical protein